MLVCVIRVLDCCTVANGQEVSDRRCDRYLENLGPLAKKLRKIYPRYLLAWVIRFVVQTHFLERLLRG